MMKDYYQRQLSLLYELGAEFSKKHPAVASLLASQGADPDVERLLQGVAFLSADLQKRLDDKFPELIQSLAGLLFPQYLRPLPAATIIQFAAKSTLKKSLKIPAGTELGSVSYGGVSTLFTTCTPLEMHPLTLWKINAAKQEIKLNFQVSCSDVTQLNTRSIRLFFTGEYAQAVERYEAIVKHIKSIRIACGEQHYDLSPEIGISELIFDDDLSLFQQTQIANTSFQHLQEYFLLPQKFLFIEFKGIDWLNNPGLFAGQTEFSIELSLNEPTSVRLTDSDLSLNCVPAVNIFHHNIEPIRLNHHSTEYLISPEGGANYQVYEIEGIEGVEVGSGFRKQYQPFSMFEPQATDSPVYSLHRRQSLTSKYTHLFLSVAYAKNISYISPEILTIKAKATNGLLTNNLAVGDICVPTDSSPLTVSFSNITTPSKAVDSLIDEGVLWGMVSHLYINQSGIFNRDNLISLLKLYLHIDDNNRDKRLANIRRIEAIEQLEVAPTKRLIKSAVVYGKDVSIQVNSKEFLNAGDLYLFGCVLKQVFNSYSEINSFVRLRLFDHNANYQMVWQPDMTELCKV